MRKLRAAMIVAVASLAPAAAAAQFQPATRYTYRGCDIMGWQDVLLAQSGILTVCVEALVTTGRHITTGEWGVSADVFREVAGYAPPSVTVEHWLSAVVMTPPGIDAIIGEIGEEYNRLPTPVTVYSPLLVADSRPDLLHGMMRINFPNVPEGEPAQFDLPVPFELVRVQVLPEPTTIALLGGGLALLGVGSVVRRRRAVGS